MTGDDQMIGGPATGNDRFEPRRVFAQMQARGCSGNCIDAARAAFEAADRQSNSLGQVRADLNKRFDFLHDVSGHDEHRQAEILLEHTLALYEALHGQEHPAVANLMLDLAALHKAHGNSDYAAYLIAWANEILNKPKDEPTHEFFHLFGYDQPDEDIGSAGS